MAMREGRFKSRWYKPLGQFFELLSVLVLVAVIGVFWIPLPTWAIIVAVVTDVLAAAGLFAAAVFCLSRATEHTDANAKAAEREANSRKHVISEQRLLVLIEEKVPRDAFEVLKRLIDSRLVFDGQVWSIPPGSPTATNSGIYRTTAENLILDLYKGLGKERTNEVKDLILKYTVEDEDSGKKPEDDSDPDPRDEP